MARPSDSKAGSSVALNFQNPHIFTWIQALTLSLSLSHTHTHTHTHILANTDGKMIVNGIQSWIYEEEIFSSMTGKILLLFCSQMYVNENQVSMCLSTEAMGLGRKNRQVVIGLLEWEWNFSIDLVFGGVAWEKRCGGLLMATVWRIYSLMRLLFPSTLCPYMTMSTPHWRTLLIPRYQDALINTQSFYGGLKTICIII